MKVSFNLIQLYGFIYFWCSDSNFCKKNSHFIVVKDVQIGGEGHVVEIDETLVTKRKYNVGKRVVQQWVFGGYDIQDKIGFMVAVPKRDKHTLERMIRKYIRPGTTIISDLWRAYGGIEKMPGLRYLHLTVNHSKNFTDPQTGKSFVLLITYAYILNKFTKDCYCFIYMSLKTTTCNYGEIQQITVSNIFLPGATTNHVESMWAAFKRRRHTNYGSNRDLLNGHLCEFMWRQRYAYKVIDGGRKTSSFSNLIAQLTHVH
jgi:hypothetical protein